MSADLTADEEKLVRAVVDTARTQGKPTPKPRLDRIIRDDAAWLLNGLQRCGYVRYEEGCYHPTLKAIVEGQKQFQAPIWQRQYT